MQCKEGREREIEANFIVPWLFRSLVCTFSFLFGRWRKALVVARLWMRRAWPSPPSNGCQAGSGGRGKGRTAESRFLACFLLSGMQVGVSFSIYRWATTVLWCWRGEIFCGLRRLNFEAWEERVWQVSRGGNKQKKNNTYMYSILCNLDSSREKKIER